MKLIHTIILVSTPALAAPAYATDAVAPVTPSLLVGTAVHDWTGFYAGVNAGLAGGTFAHPLTLSAPGGPVFLDSSFDLNASGFLGGAQIGYNHQSGTFVFGIEADVQLANVEGVFSFSAIDTLGSIGAPGDTLTLRAGTSVDALATLRPRVGFTHDDILLYATGGLAYGQVTSSVRGDINGTAFLDESATVGTWGYSVGAGVELALSDDLSFKTEYLYTDLGANTLYDDGTLSIRNDTQFHTVRAGVNFSF